MISRVRTRLARVAAIVRRIIGAPDYESYLAHAQVAHAGEAVLTRDEFYRMRLEDRYSRPGSKCC